MTGVVWKGDNRLAVVDGERREVTMMVSKLTVFSGGKYMWLRDAGELVRLSLAGEFSWRNGELMEEEDFWGRDEKMNHKMVEIRSS